MQASSELTQLMTSSGIAFLCTLTHADHRRVKSGIRRAPNCNIISTTEWETEPHKFTSSRIAISKPGSWTYPITCIGHPEARPPAQQAQQHVALYKYFRHHLFPPLLPPPFSPPPPPFPCPLCSAPPLPIQE